MVLNAEFIPPVCRVYVDGKKVLEYKDKNWIRKWGVRVVVVYGRETPDGFHVYGLDWSRDGYVYYIDGAESWRVNAPVSDREQFILISTECNGYRNGDEPAEELKQAVLPDAFMVDYVRVFDDTADTPYAWSGALGQNNGVESRRERRI